MRTLLRAASAIFIALFVLLASSTTAKATAPYVGIDLFPITGPDGFISLEIGTAYGGNPVGGQVVGSINYGANAVVWSAPTGVPINLHPSGYIFSAAAGTDGVHQVGYAYDSSEFQQQHAMLWSGTAASAIDLHPTNLGALRLTSSYANGVYGNQQVGAGQAPDHIHALLWNGSANSAVDLDPILFGPTDNSVAMATDGNQQVGFVNRITPDGEQSHAILWNGTAESAVDLQPVAATYSGGNGVTAGQQVGFAQFGVNTSIHAMLWTGTAASAVDLSPTNLSGFADSNAYGTKRLTTSWLCQIRWQRHSQSRNGLDRHGRFRCRPL